MRNILRKSSWKYQDDRSNKEYHFQLIETENGHIVEFQHGAVGGNLKADTKTQTPVTLEEATKVFDGMTKERVKKQYEGGETDATSGFSLTPTQVKKEIVLLPQLLNEVEYPEIILNDERYVMQEKHNGQRRTVIQNKDGITGGNKLGTAVPLSDALIKSLPDYEFSIDCEIIGDKLFVFDALVLNSADISHQGFLERFRRLEKMFKFNKNIVLSRIAVTKEEKHAMFAELKARNAEGFVGKDKNAEYKAGRPNSGGDQLKFKWYKTASFIVGNHTKGKRSVGLEMIDEKGNRTSVGKITIPANKEIPAIDKVVEAEYLYAHKGTNAIFQSKYIKERTVVSIAECKLTQLIYKEELAGDDDDE